MKTFRIPVVLTLLGLLAITLRPQSQAQIVAPMPDLTITSVTESGLTTKVTVKNIGTGNAPGCKLRGYYWNGAAWVAFQTINISPLAVGASKVITITDIKVGAWFNKYFIDATNLVVESKEINNWGYYPEPQG